jgi:hypothetical protein
MHSEQSLPNTLKAAKASFESRQSGEHVIDFERASDAELAAELAILNQRPELAKDLVQIIYGTVIPNDATFYEPLVAFAQYLNFSDNAKEIIGITWAQAFTRLNAVQVEAVLVELPAVGQFFVMILGSLPHLVRRQHLSSDTVVHVNEIVAKHLADKFGPGLERALEAFAEKQPTEAIEVLSNVTPADNNMVMLAVLLGRLRTGPDGTSLAAAVTQFETKFKNSAQLVDREVFYRSWFQEAFAHSLTVDHIAHLCETADAKGAEDIHVIITLLSIWMSTPLMSPQVFRRAFEWVQQRVSPTISDVGKLQVAQFASFFNADQYQWPDTWRPAIDALVIAILPIDAAHLGIWDKLDFYLGSLLPADPTTFQTVLRALADRSGESWLSVLRNKPSMAHLRNQMNMVRQDQLVAEFCLSADRTRRHIGLFFFAKLHVPAFSPADLAACDPRICWILLYEVASRTLSKQSAARCLLSLLTQAGRLGPEFVTAMKEELQVQARNLPGACGEMFTQNAAGNPILQDVMAEQDKYFKALAKTKKSPVLQMQVPGYHRAMEEFTRKFGNEVHEGARQNSVFMQMVHEVAILYGLAWSTFQGNQLGATTNMQRISHGTELPRLDLIDPEGMQMDRLFALTQIRALENDIQENP